MDTLKDIWVRMLRASERYTKTDMVYLTTGGFWLVAGQAGAAAMALLFSLVVAHFLSQETYGTYRYILSIAAIVGAISLTGLGTTIVRSVARGFDASLRHGFRKNLMWSAPMLIGFAGISGYYLFQEATVLAISIAIAGLGTVIINSASLFNTFWNGKKDFYRQTLYWTIGNVAATGAAIVAILISDNLIALVGTYFTVSALTNFALYLFVVRGIPPAPETIEEQGYAKDALHLSILNFLNTVSGNIDKIIVFQMLGTVQLAIYSFALALPEQIRAVLKAGARLALPRFVEQKFSDIQTNLTEKLIRFSFVILVLASIYALAAPFVFSFLFPAYIESVPYSQLFALLLFAALGNIPLAALQAHAKVHALYIHAIIINIVQIGSSILFIYYFGLWGAAMAVLLNRLLGFILPWYLVKRS